jgi:Rha family phage regulatory protein
MEELKITIENIKGTLVTTSNRVAEELGVQHKDLLEKIDNYISKFSSAELSAQFYIPSNYKTLNGRTVRNYLITKKGIAQLIGGYSAAVERAFELNVAYINRFDEMERELMIRNILKPVNSLDEDAMEWLTRIKTEGDKASIHLSNVRALYTNLAVHCLNKSDEIKDMGIPTDRITIEVDPHTKQRVVERDLLEKE